MASPIITPMPVQTDTNYRPISRMAVIGLILALPSMLIFTSDSLFWMLFVVILPAFILCCVAWKSIRNSQGNLAGEPLAVLGIVISLASGLGWMTMTAVSQYVTESEARTAVDSWISKMQNGESGSAFLMRVSPSRRMLDFNPEEHNRLRKQFPGQQQEVSEYDNFLVDDVCGQLLRYGNQVKVTYNGLVEAKSIKETPVFRFSYAYDGPAKKGSFVVSARSEDFNSQDGVRRDWVLSIDNNANVSQDTRYGAQLRTLSVRAAQAVENFVAVVANPPEEDILKKMIDPKNEGELKTVTGYIRPRDKTGFIGTKTRKPMHLRADKQTGNTITTTFDCTALIDDDRAVDFSIDYSADITKPETAILQNCRFLGTRKLAKASGGGENSDLAKFPPPGAQKPSK